MNQGDPTRSRRWVLHLDMDAFFASAEQLTRPTLRGRPVLVGGLGGRGVVAGASYEARVFGARSAMPMHQARRMVGGGAVVLPPRMSLYSVLSKRTFDALRLRMPILEQLSVDEAFGEPVELAGVGADEVRAFCEDLRALIKAETGLVASIGAGAGKQVAKIASGLAKPDGVAVIPPGMQHELLDPLPVRKLWGIGPVAEEKLKRLGIETIGGFARTPIAEVASILGTTVGPGLHRLAQGIDDRPVAERAESKQISAESTFAADIVTMAQLRAAVESSGRAAFSRLEKDGRAARTVVLKLKKSDMSILTRSVTLPFATIDRQILVATAQKQVIDPQELGPIRLVGVGFAGLSTVRQGSLFPELDQDVPGYPVETLTGALDEAELDVPVAARVPQRYWHPGLDVKHPEYGHGWVQGAGHGVVTVRFETRSSGTGIAKTFAESDEVLEVADAVDSLL
ncbi:DNA polymerase IV [Rhodococcus sp. WS1]|jgi:DNA polymerase-4|uniref:DNA polymerase IV n=2 Tax=Rhodococcus erythropolis TaxID=1833 RepID=C1A0W3_RHOE4|nr:MULTISPECIES: DNA polymerase IV [Rhodococcus]MCD2155500.1 DNA polymerase IV [Rhodococcus cerastii]AGT93089.1 DNA polymerase IV [Rhodococcus erythropolis CCM2595]AKD98130.1 DNA polymerase IV [Rhodococcus erythropolis]ATI32774.1 DNA polymerase IV [Rhodococcus sp. H-CA8f]MBF7734714.1 DNA polymerase IV [Rhodococcus erythropolis]